MSYMQEQHVVALCQWGPLNMTQIQTTASHPVLQAWDDARLKGTALY